MKRTILVLLAILTLTTAATRAQEREQLLRPWGAGFHLGLGAMAPTGSLGDEFKGCAVFNGGLDLEYNRARLKIDATYSQPSFKNANPYSLHDEQGRDLQLNGTSSVTSVGASVQLGYTAWHNGKVSVTPSVGVNFNRLNWNMNEITWKSDDQGEERPMIDRVSNVHENSTGWTASVDIDIKLSSKFVDSGSMMNHYTSSVRFTPFIAHASYRHFNPSAKGNWVGMTVSYAGLFRFLSTY